MFKNCSLFSISFRPFFILAGIIAFINPILWVYSYLGHFSLVLDKVDPLFWHAHEMIFGFSGALIAGFILTASANWTNSKPYQGRVLVLLTFAWLVERISYFLPFNIHVSALLMNLFFPLLLIFLYAKLDNFPKQRNVFIPILLGITVSKLFHSFGYIYSIDYLEFSGKHIAIGLVRLIVLLIAGRVIPFFTRKKIDGISINLPSWITPLSLLPIFLLCLPWSSTMPKLPLVIVLILAITANITRQLMWKPHRTINVPILFILHIGIACINIGLILELLAQFYPQINYTKAPMHMLMAGGLGIVSIGIMTRVTLGHTGRDIKADNYTIFLYAMIVLGSLVRGFVPLLLPKLYFMSLYVASILWGGGFLIFLIRYFHVLFRPRPDGKPY